MITPRFLEIAIMCLSKKEITPVKCFSPGSKSCSEDISQTDGAEDVNRLELFLSLISTLLQFQEILVLSFSCYMFEGIIYPQGYSFK